MNFDLNIANYNKNELREMFDLPGNYDKNSVEMKEQRLRENILYDKNVDSETREQTINFLTKAKNILLRNINNSNEHLTTLNETNKLLKNIGKAYHTNSRELIKTSLESPEEHMVQEKQRTPVLLSYPTDTVTGNINPLKRRLRKENLVIDTRFRENYYNSSATNFNVQLPMVVEKVVDMKLTAIELPITYYTISKQYNNNFFSLIVSGKGKVIEIPSGNYDFNTLQSIINKQVFILGDDFRYISFEINSSNANGTGQMMVGLKPTTPLDKKDIPFELNFQADIYGNDDRNTPLPLKFGWIMGFRNGIYTNNQNYVSESIVSISGPRYVYLVIDDFNNNNNNGLFYGVFNSSMLNKNILARVSLQTGALSVLSQNNLNLITVSREYFGPVNIRNFQVQLLDEYGRVLDLNYMDFSFCLSLTTVYDI